LKYHWRQISLGMAITEAFGARIYERNPRRGTLQPKFLCHRFPVKDGMTWSEVGVELLMDHRDALVERLEREMKTQIFDEGMK
jgi:hypothetical protein